MLKTTNASGRGIPIKQLHVYVSQNLKLPPFMGTEYWMQSCGKYAGIKIYCLGNYSSNIDEFSHSYPLA